MKLKLFYTLTFTTIISLCCLMSCGSSSEQMSDEEIEQLAQEKFQTLTDTLQKQYYLECDSMYSRYRQAMVDSLIFDFLKSEDSTANSNTNSIKTPNQ